MALSNLPERTPFFTGREQVLIQLQEALAARGQAALSGLGGVGKTQTALEYAHRHLDEYVCTLWVTADSSEALVSGYVTIASLLKLPEADSQDQMLAAEAVKRWLGSNQCWLLILDNADDLAVTREFVPPGNNGHVLLTTQAWATGAVARFVEIQEMGTEEGALFLSRRAKYIAEDAPLDEATEADQATAREIVTQLDGLPLALDQAGAYIEETGCGLSGYLDLYRSHSQELLQRRGTLGSDHPPVATTWALSLEKIEQANPAAAELLRFCAFLHPDGIPEEVFSKGALELGPVLEPVGSDAFKLNAAISEILKYSLLRRDPRAKTLAVHRLVQAELKQPMDQDAQRLWAERAVRAVNRAFPDVALSTRAGCERILPQAHACAELINQWGFEFPEGERLLNRAGAYLFERGRYTDAELFYRRALGIREKALDPEHPDLATSFEKLALLLHAINGLQEAERLFLRALAIYEKSFGQDDANVARALDNLAMLLKDTKREKQAESLMRRALEINEKIYGPDDPEVATALDKLAELFRKMNRFKEAKPLYRRALKIDKKSLGPEHPNVARDLSNLSILLMDTKRLKQAEPLMWRALQIDEKSYGPEHPSVAIRLNNLGELYAKKGQHAKAKPLVERALAIREKALGLEHPHVATSLSDLADIYANQGQYAKAEPCYRRALEIREKALDPEHPDMATCLENYALCLRAMGRSDKATPLEARARTIRAKSA